MRSEVRDVGVDPNVAAAARDRRHEFDGNVEVERVTRPAADEEQPTLVVAPLAVLGGHDVAELSVTASNCPAGDVFEGNGVTELRQ